jgi:uncharacterized protein YecT (DUF1311 family)
MKYLALIAGLLPMAAMAQEVDCANAMTQSDMNACAFADWEATDKALNAAYKKARLVMQNLDADLPELERGAEDALKTGQKAWITFRDATCMAEGYVMHGGSAEPLLVYGCMARLTEQRTADLNMMGEYD